MSSFTQKLWGEPSAAYDNGKFSEAERLCAGILAVNDRYLDARHLLALTQSELGNYNAALDNYNRVLAINPGFADALNNRGNTLQKLGRFDEALESYQRALALRPDYAEALNNRGNALHNLKRFDEALESLGQALEIRSDYADTLNNRGVIFQELGRFDEALEMLRAGARHQAGLCRCPQQPRHYCFRVSGASTRRWRVTSRRSPPAGFHPEALNNRGISSFRSSGARRGV